MKTKLLSAFVLLFMSIAANAYDVEVDGVYYNLNLTDQTAIVTSPSTENSRAFYKGEVVVPANFSYNGQSFTVVGVNDFSFSNSESLTSVSLPNTIMELPTDLFFNCQLLTHVDLPNNISQIPVGCFEYCKSLGSISLPESVKVIDYSAFHGCSSFGPEFIVRSNLEVLGDQALGSCPNLKRVIIEDSEDSLSADGDYSHPLSHDVLDYMYIGRSFNCITEADTIKVLELGASLKTNAFPRDNNFTTIISDIEDPTLFDPEFTNATYLNVPLYVPVGKVDAYRQAEGWKNFFDIRENHGEVNKIDNVAAAKKAGATMYYNLSGQAVAKDYKGVVIERYSDGTSKKVLNK